MTDQEKLLDWCRKNVIHDYRKGTVGHKLLTSALIERYQSGTQTPKEN